MRLSLAFLALSTTAAVAQDAVPLLPDPTKTPGPVNPALDQRAICKSSFSTKSYRAGSKAARRCVLSRYGKPAFAFTYDHLVPLELGGADTCDNLWPEPRAEARLKDRLEDALQAHVCACGDVSLPAAQEMFRRDWWNAYAVYVTPKGSPMCTVNRAVFSLNGSRGSLRKFQR